MKTGSLRYPLSPEPFVSRAKDSPAKTNEKGYGNENEWAPPLYFIFIFLYGTLGKKECLLALEFANKDYVHKLIRTICSSSRI